jgi:MoaA/NifB/PqqE/SkfB family radical SAM enzyme
MTPKQRIIERFEAIKNNRIEYYHQHFDGRKAYVPYPPLWVTVGITGNCAFKCQFCCSHCPDAGKDEKASHQYKIPFNITLDDFKKIVDLCHEAGVPRIHVCGTGEPFLHPRILEILDYVISVYSHVSLQTDFIKVIFDKKQYIDEIIKREKHITYITTDIFPQRVHEAVKMGSDFEYLLHCMERISHETDIPFGAHVLLTKQTYQGLTELLLTLHNRKIHFYLELVHLLPFGFNAFTSLDNVYMSSDIEIKVELDRLREAASSHHLWTIIPQPWDVINKNGMRCTMFWRKVQLMPSKKLAKERWCGNAIPQQCNAVVTGDIFSIGNVFDYENFMDFWNNNKLIGIRKKIMSGELPDEACRSCYIGAQGRFEKLTVSDKFKRLVPGKFFI